VSLITTTLFEHGSPVHHSVTVHIADSCTTGAHYTIDSVMLDVGALT
jgi:hypothetical protein